APVNVAGLAVGPDGALYFTMGGRGSQGGLYRIVYSAGDSGKPVPGLQPLSAWGRAVIEAARGKAVEGEWSRVARGNTNAPVPERMQALNILQLHGPAPSAALLVQLAQDGSAQLRAHAVWLVGVNGYKEGKNILIKALNDADALVRRRACEALIRAGFEPPVDVL